MGLEFLRNNGGRRMRQYDEQPFLLNEGVTLEEQPDARLNHSYEIAADQWRPKNIPRFSRTSAWPQRPTRFVDGKDVGSTVAWLRTRDGYPVPVRLSQIGAVVMRNEGGILRREYTRVERVVSMMIDPFPWDEVESFAMALQAEGYRLLPCAKPENGWTYDFERMRKTTQNGSMEEMLRLERLALAQQSETPTLVDGRLEPRERAFDAERDPVVGLVKTHREMYLHPRGWQVYFDLVAGQRTPAFTIQQHNLNVVSWYVRLDGTGDMPNWGVVRLEVPERYFATCLGRDWSYLDRLSALAQEYRSHDATYGRAPVTIHPIQRAEESLGALFATGDQLISHFYHLTSL